MTTLQAAILRSHLFAGLLGLVTDAFEPDMLFARLLALLRRVGNAGRGAVVLLEGPSRPLVRAVAGFPPESAPCPASLVSPELLSRLRSGGGPLLLAGDPPAPLPALGDALRLPRAQVAYCVAPFSEDGRPLGYLAVDGLDPESLGLREQAALLDEVAQHVSRLLTLGSQVDSRLRHMRAEIGRLRALLADPWRLELLAGESPAMTRVREVIETVVPDSSSVLFLGESGTGRRLAATILHRLADGGGRPLHVVDCGALTEATLEAELFGGGDARAALRRPGATAGSIYLHQLHRLAPALQPLLHRLLVRHGLDSRLVPATPDGAPAPRLLGSSAPTLPEDVERGLFSRELYMLASEVVVRIPPLRDRPEDIPAILNHLLARLEKRAHFRISFGERALEWMARYPWPGNIRQMEGLLERFAAAGLREVDLDDIPPEYAPEAVGASLRDRHSALRDLEKREVVAALERNSWVQSRAARDLGITLRQMGYRIKKYQLEKLLLDRRQPRRPGRLPHEGA